jgi:NAD(P)-dependent dehydrogenase (short-subunit alcohol dehydrogenase family)
MKIAIVTGANTGLGFETTLALAKKEYTVVLACRNEQKAQDAIDRIKEKVPSARLAFIKLDLIDRQVIREFADIFSRDYDHLDLLVNNAGVMGPEYTITPNHLELQFDANHMGHFYLTYLLFDKLDQDFETRIVNVSSLGGKRETADIHFENINFEGTYHDAPQLYGLPGMWAYQQSKLANILFTMELNERLVRAGKKIKAVVVHPGLSGTDIMRNASGGMQMSVRLLRLLPFLRSAANVSLPAEGAEALVYASLAPNVEGGDFIGPTGKNETTGKPGKVDLPPKALDKDRRDRLWSLSENNLGIQFNIQDALLNSPLPVR